MSFIISNNRPLGYPHKLNSQWLPVLLVRAMGYSSFIAAIVSMIVYWYKKQSLEKEANTVQDELYLNPKKKLHITTGLRRTSSSLKRISSNLANESQVMNVPSSL
jgi:hypothetical protein